MAKAFATKFVVIRKFQKTETSVGFIADNGLTNQRPIEKTPAFFYFQTWDFNISFPWLHEVKGNEPYTKTKRIW